MVLFLREAMRAIATLSCEGVMRAIASSMSPHATPQQGPTPILSAATADGITTVQTVSAAATTLPTTPTRDAARVKGCCTDRAVYLLCSAAQLTCCSSPTATASWLTSSMLPHVSLGASQLLNLRRHHREATAAGIGLGTTSRRRKPIVESCVDNTAKLRPQASVLARSLQACCYTSA